MLQNSDFLAKIGADTDENERNFAENLPKIGNYPTGPLPYPRRPAEGQGGGGGRRASPALPGLPEGKARAPLTAELLGCW